MRIKKEVERSGLFWLPAEPKRKVPGTLSITDGGGIELKLLGTLGPFYERIERILGKIEWEGDVTLDDCLCTSKQSSHGVEESLIRVNMVFTGLAYSEDESPSFDSLIFSVEGIDEWVGISGIMADTEVAKGIKTISFQQPADIAINLENGMCLSITFDCEFPFDLSVISDDGKPFSETYFATEATIHQKTYFKLVSQDVCKLVDFTSVAAKIKNLLCIGIGQIVSFDRVWAISDNHRVNVYFRNQPHTKDEPFIDWDLLIFGLKDMGTDAERRINTWIRVYEKFAPALNLFFLTQTESHVNTEDKFLSLVQGLEAFHRQISDEKQMREAEFRNLADILIKACPDGKQTWLIDRLRYGNELSLRQRIKRIIEPNHKMIGSKKARNELIDRIVNTRNYLTHYDSALEPRVAKGENLEMLCLKMESLFRLELLQLIGFSGEKSIIMTAEWMPHEWHSNCKQWFPQLLGTW